MATEAVLEIRGLCVAFGAGEVLRDIDLTVERGGSYGLVGESGSGKTTMAMAAMRHLPAGALVTAGSVRLCGLDMLDLGERELREVWRKRVRLVPQDPGPSLNPAMVIGRQLAESLPERARGTAEQVREMLVAVGMRDPVRVAESYPHQLSGGMQQRALIAMALAARPDLLILDEPTTNLDVTTEATILDMVGELVRANGTALLYVSHALGTVARVCDRVAVLYAGELVEDAQTSQLFERPLHPYTVGLLGSVPKLGQHKRSRRLRPIPGRVPEPSARPTGCVFAPRCPVATDFTREERPRLERADETRRVRCHRWQEIAEGSLDPRQSHGGHPAAGDPGRQSATAALEERGTSSASRPPTLEVVQLEKSYDSRKGVLARLAGRRTASVRAVDGVDLRIEAGRTLGVVGESGSGKSTMALCIAGMEAPDGGQVRLQGDAPRPTVEKRDRETLGRLQMVFQDPATALNPHLSVGESLRRPLLRLSGLGRAAAAREVPRLLAQVGLPPSYARRLPGALSGGERQRVAIARANASQPALLLLDESVSSLDASVQGLVLNLLADLQLEQESAYMFISHDFAAVAYLADDIAVMYRGRLMESGPASAVLEPPYHPYTEALLSAVPLLDPGARQQRIRLEQEPEARIPGAVRRGAAGAGTRGAHVAGRGDVGGGTSSDTAGRLGQGCPFHSRCPRFLGDICVKREPPWRRHISGKGVYCHIPLDELEEVQERAFDFAAGPEPDQGQRAVRKRDDGDG